jgi:ubiquinone/menaquinone biosynthesis C-methylase UbiE
MDKRQKEATKRYQDLLTNQNVNLAVTVGREPHHSGLAKIIWADITRKISLKPNSKVLDIGCGFGEVTELCLKEGLSLNLELHLVDIPEAISRIRTEMSSKIYPEVVFWDKIFPETINLPSFPSLFNTVLAYSVLHYTDKPEYFIERAVSLLADGGQLLLGDLPNVHKKGRFLSSYFGRAFDAAYKGLNLNDVPFYKNHDDFYEQCTNQNKKINDNLISNTIKKYRKRGYHVYVLSQSEKLPFSYTREDLLICKP